MWFFVIVFVILFAVAIVYSQHRRGALNAAFGRLAAQYGGTVNRGGWGHYPSVYFEVRSTPVRIDIHSTGGEDSIEYTQVHLRWPEPAFRCEIYPEGFVARVRKFFGMEDIQIGSPDFDRDFVITSNNVQRVRELLRGDVQHRIHELRRYLNNYDILISVCHGTLLIKKRGLMEDFGQLSRFTRLALGLHELMLAVNAAGIEYLDPPAAGPADRPVCQICGEQIEQETVHCRRCHTPHHRDCWEYYGACSTYGCGETNHSP